MKIALDWIADYLSPAPTPPSAAAVADALMNAGLPVESITEAQGVKAPTKVLDVEVTSNRTDCFSHVGLARELSALLGGTFSLPKISLTESATPAASAVAVEIQDPAACLYYSARIVKNVKVAPSPEWLQRRLESIGLRPVNNIVDVTNFVLMELGQPLHAFDYDQLVSAGAGKTIIPRRAAPGEKMQAIDGKEYALEPTMLVIADEQKPAAIAGIMGGKASEVTEKTTTILLESARFEPLTIRTASRALGLKSDSSFRFERGIDPAMADFASRRAAQLILQVAGGELLQGAVTAGSAFVKPLTVAMRMKRFEQIVGIPIAAERATAILNALGFACWTDEGHTSARDDDAIAVRVPSHRLDIDREIDLIEEVARIHGYSHIPTLDRVSHPVAPEPPREKAIRALRRAMVEAGFSEAVTLTFIPEADAAIFSQAFNGTAIATQHGGWKTDVLRPSLIPSLLAVRRTNQYAGLPDAHLFETASIFLQQGDPRKTPPLERKMLTALAGDVGSLTAAIRLVALALNPTATLAVEPAPPNAFPFYVPGTSGEIVLTTSKASWGLANVGLIMPELQKRYDLRHAVAAMEIDLEFFLASFEPVRRAQPIPRFPGVERDLSIVVDETTRWADVQQALRAATLQHLEKITFVTTFRNAQIGPGKKSLTLKMEFRDPARTLKSEEVDTQVKTAVETLAAKFSATLRA